MNNDHIVKSFDQELDEIASIIARMGGLAEQQLHESVAALLAHDRDRARAAWKSDKKIDALEAEVDQLAIRVLALRQPMAEDLRTVIAILKISSNLERIGDYAKNVAKRTVALADTESINLPDSAMVTIKTMGEKVESMISRVLTAFANRDTALADDVRASDEEVDQLHNTLFREQLTYMMEDPRNITPSTHLLFMAKNVERIGDHVTSVAEQIHFMVAGAYPDEERAKSDITSMTVVEPE